LRWLPNLPSVFESVVTGAEKLHILYHKGEWRDDSYQYAKGAKDEQEKERAVANESPKPSDVALEKTKQAMFLSMQNGLGMQFVRAATDILDVARAYDLSGKPAPRRFSRMSKKLHKLLSKNDAEITRQALKRVVPKGTGNNCFHIQDSSGGSSALPPVALTSDGNGFAVRLDTLVQSFRGETTMSPLESFSFSRGGMVFSHDTVTNELKVYHEASSLFRVDDIDGTHLDHGSTFYMGSLTKRLGPLGTDMRKGMPSPAEFKHELWKSYQAIPMDYEQLFNANCTEGDPNGNYASAMEAFSSFNTTEYMMAVVGRVTEAERLRIFHGVAEVIAIAVKSGCMSGLIAGSIPNSHGFGMNAAMVVLHMLMEIPPSHLGGVILDPNWNRMDLSSMTLSM